MTETLSDWLSYNSQLDVIFSSLWIVAIVIILAGFIILRTSARLFRIVIRAILFLAALGLAVGWFVGWWPWV